MVPNGWDYQPLSKLLEKIIDYRGQSVPKANNGVPLITARNVRDGYLDFTSKEYVSDQDFESWMKRGTPRAGDIIFTTEAPLGKACRFPETGRFAVGQRTVTLRTNSMLDSDYLLYFILSEHGQNLIDLSSSGSTAKGIKSSELKKVKVSFPTNLSEQKKIAKILSTWDRTISITEQLLANSQQQKKALMQQLLTGKKRLGIPDKSYELQKTRYGTIPKDWEYPAIKDICTQVTQKNTVSADYPVLSCSKYDGFVDSLKYFKKKVYSDDTSGYRLIHRGCFGFPSNHVEEGSIGLQNLYDTGIVSPIYVVFRAKTKKVDNDYLYAVLKTDHYRQIFGSATNASVDRRGSLRWKEFSLIHVPLPPLDEQQKIAAVLSTADKEITALQQKLDVLKQEKKALMQQLLTGKRRVKVEEVA
ncbi:restriction endonuclease subunit S [Aeromonas veronii]|uniref:restriction endonuclease subunit S n=1 Tax=Aeromonas veronii TaxID=654 RepID=UPI000C76FD1E|nr:restriction endonuclease subunit S [Aeromonas veronii]AYK20114.1 restriction endonuclease subunit S [Aeromonas veronii]